MSAVRKTKRKSQPPRSGLTYVRRSKNNPNFNNHNQPDDIFDDNLEEYFNNHNQPDDIFDDNLEEYFDEDNLQDNLQDNFDEDNESDNNNNNNQQQQEDMIIDDDQNQEYYDDDQERSDDDQEYSNQEYSDKYQECFDDYQDCSDDDQEYTDDNQEYSDDNQEYSDDDHQDNQDEDNFTNISIMMMFTWITKHMIGRNAYRDLIRILKNEDFNLQDIPHNIQTLKEQNKHLPLYKIRKNTVKINKEKAPSNSQPTKIAYSISIIDHIRAILENTQISPLLYFGPGIEDDQKSEFWHGKIWQESPLFGITNIKYNEGMKYNIVISILILIY